MMVNENEKDIIYPLCAAHVSVAVCHPDSQMLLYSEWPWGYKWRATAGRSTVHLDESQEYIDQYDCFKQTVDAFHSSKCMQFTL